MYELIPHAGFDSVGRMLRDVDSVFGRFWEPDAGDFKPSVDIKETDDQLLVNAEVPGLAPEDLEVTLTGDVLTIKGEKRQESEREESGYHLVERRYGSFQRSFKLPAEVDREKLKASHRDGVLTVTLPKAAKPAPTQVEVKGG